MFDVLVFLYENYGGAAVCPDADSLTRSLADAGFEQDEITDALDWLSDLASVTREAVSVRAARAGTFRVFAGFERDRLGGEALSFLAFLESEGQLDATQREIVIERALAYGESPLPLAKLKVIVLMVLWSLQADVDALMLEELLDDGDERLLH